MTKLPEPDTHCEDLDTGKEVWSYSRELVEQIVRDALEAQERELNALKATAAIVLERMRWLNSCSDVEMGDGDAARDEAAVLISLLTGVLKADHG